MTPSLRIIIRLFSFGFLILVLVSAGLRAQQPLRVAVVGISHGHTGWIFNRKDKHDIEIVAVVEKDQELVQRYRKRYNLPASLFFTDIAEMIAKTRPEAITAFGPINEHVQVVRAAAPKGVHVMVEKPLATTFKDAIEIEGLARKYGTRVLTNFETSWYASNQYVYDLLKTGKLGEIRRVIVNDGHSGPAQMDPKFVGWLTDPVQNGGGALTDFGCYGANLMTWLMDGEIPRSVTAITNQNRPDVYPKVDDDATIILRYPTAQCVIQPSWSWTFSRKDMEVYGTKGYAIAVDATTVRVRLSDKEPEKTIKLDPRPAPHTDPFPYCRM